MRKLLLVLIVCSAVCACVCQHKDTPLSAVSSEEEIPTVQEETIEPPVVDIATDTSKEIAQTDTPKPSTSSPAKVTPVSTPKKPATTPKVTDSPKAQPQAFDVAAAEKLIKEKRTAQTLIKPQPDTASFNGEELISTAGRRLGPFSYEPVVQAKTDAPWSEEELKYGVYYSFVKAGTAYIKNRGLSVLNGRKAYLIQTTAFSASVIDSVFKVRDVNYSWLDAENYYSLGYTQSLREGNYIRDEWITFDPANKRYYGEVQKKKGVRTIAGKMDMPVLDMLTALYFVRAQKLEVGKNIVFDIINREEQYPLVVKVLKKETVKTAAGKFQCVVVEPQFRGEGIFVAKGKSLKVWLTDDAYKMPVRMETEVFIGSVSAELLEYKRN